MKRYLLAALAALLVGCTGASIVPTPTEPVVTVTPTELQLISAEPLAPLMRSLITAYQRTHPHVQVVLLERAETLAWQALEQGDADVVAVNGRPTPVLEDVWQVSFARDGLAVVVNPQNGLPGVTMAQLRDLFQGRVDDWTTWGGLPGTPELISREEASGDYRFFQREAMTGLPVSLTALVAPSSEAVLTLVADQPLAVGYLSTARLTPQVRALAIDGVPPSAETIASDLYPLSRELFLVTAEPPSAEVRAFVQWALSSEGQAVVRRQGLLSPQP
jgi:phosphate transport system substrate-binding protein